MILLNIKTDFLKVKYVTQSKFFVNTHVLNIKFEPIEVFQQFCVKMTKIMDKLELTKYQMRDSIN